MSRTRTERPALTDAEVYDRQAALLQERIVPALNEALGLDPADTRNRVTYGYIGNLEWNGRDDRSWYIFLPHPGRVGTALDRIGGHVTGDLVGIQRTVEAARGALAALRWVANR